MMILKRSVLYLIIIVSGSVVSVMTSFGEQLNFLKVYQELFAYLVDPS